MFCVRMTQKNKITWNKLISMKNKNFEFEWRIFVNVLDAVIEKYFLKKKKKNKIKWNKLLTNDKWEETVKLFTN